MKRLLVLFAVLVPLSLFVAGCGGTGGSSVKAGPESEKKMQEMKEMMMKGKAEMMQKGQGGGTPGGAAKQ